MHEPGYSEAAARNTEVIFEVLRDTLPASARVLEVGTGTGQHAVEFAQRLAGVLWTPADRPGHLLDVMTRRDSSNLPNLLEPVELDLLQTEFPSGPFDAVLACNVIHIAPWPATEKLFQGAARALTPGGNVILYGPYRFSDRPFEPSNASFDASLRARDPQMGIRLFEDVQRVANQSGFKLAVDHEMPANNRMMIWGRT